MIGDGNSDINDADNVEDKQDGGGQSQSDE